VVNHSVIHVADHNYILQAQMLLLMLKVLTMTMNKRYQFALIPNKAITGKAHKWHSTN